MLGVPSSDPTGQKAGRTTGSWFGALGLGDSTLEEGAASQLERGEWRDAAAIDTRLLSREARRIAGLGETGFERLLGAFLAARALLGVALLGTEIVITWFGARPLRSVVLALCVVYAVMAVAAWRSPQHADPSGAAPTRLRRRQWFLTIGVDVLVFSALQLINGSNYSALLVLPVMMASVLTPRRLALAVTAACALVILLSAGLARVSDADAPVVLTQAGLAGMGLFVVCLLAGELSGRLAREEQTARGSLELARRQAQLNRLVLEEMQDGVMVVDRRGRVRAANPAARSLLGEAARKAVDTLVLGSTPSWAPLMQAVESAFADGHWPEAGRDLVLPSSAEGDGLRQIRLRIRFTRRASTGASEDYCVLFLEDLRMVQARLRQEKLAAMGRVSAGIAHEIRNPLAAIMQANALLSEDATTPEQRQLTRMVSDNAERLKRIVDDVMEVAPGNVPEPTPVDATALVAAICAEWACTVQLPRLAANPLRVELPDGPLGVVFEAEHLRRVLVNLLDNALRHGSRDEASLWVRLSAADEERVKLVVASDGEPIAPDVERFLFEPFFSTRSRGTGLGLYICRELCERYGASIDYATRPRAERHRNLFSVSMRRAPHAAPLHTDPGQTLSA